MKNLFSLFLVLLCVNFCYAQVYVSICKGNSYDWNIADSQNDEVIYCLKIYAYMCELYHSLYLFIHMKSFMSIHDHNFAKSSHRWSDGT